MNRKKKRMNQQQQSLTTRPVRMNDEEIEDKKYKYHVQNAEYKWTKKKKKRGDKISMLQQKKKKRISNRKKKKWKEQTKQMRYLE